MAGRGPRPKPPEQKAGADTNPIPYTHLNFEAVPPPVLPKPPQWLAAQWPPQTLRWWQTWCHSAQASLFTETDWDFLVDTALVHAKAWLGDFRCMAELRLRVAKFGATQEDRARLRIIAETGVDPDAPTDDEAKGKARPKYGEMRIVADS